MDTPLHIPPTHPHGNPAPETSQPGRHRAAILACALLLSLVLGQTARAAPGDLDPSFDADGLVLTHFGRIDDDSPDGRNDFARAVAVQPDGKLVVAGVGSQAEVLVRYNPNGSLDTSFGSDGHVSITEFEQCGGFQFAGFLAVQPGGQITVAVTGFHPSLIAAPFLFLKRFKPDGSLDPSFGSSGCVLTNKAVGLDQDVGATTSAQSDGKIVVAGAAFAGFDIERYNSDGSLDTGFGAGGGVLTDFFPEAINVQADGKLVVAGLSSEDHLAFKRILT